MNADSSDDPDPDAMTFYIVICVVLVILSAFFSATETAFSAVNKTKLKVKAQDGDSAAKNALDLAEHYDRLLFTILIGNNIVNLTIATVFTLMFENVISGSESLSAAVSTAACTVVVLVFGEITPKTLAKESPEQTAAVLGYPIRFFMVILFPLTVVFSGLKKLLRKVFKFGKDVKITEEELLTMVEEAQEEGSLDKNERELISSAIEFDDAEVGDILVPRVSVVAVPIDLGMAEIKALFLEHAFSRMPVYNGTIDSVVGMIHEIDFFAALERGETDIRNIVTPTAVATEHMKISTLLRSMQKQKVHLAVVVDEYGGTLGIATLEDILEELVGEIWDEHDEVVDYFSKVDEYTYIVDGRAELDDFFNLFGIETKEDDFASQTVSGWVIEQLGYIPKKFENFRYKNLTVIVNRLTQRKVLEVKIVIDQPKTEDDKDKKDKEKDKDR